MHRLDFQKIVENAEEGIFLISTNGVIQYSNPAGEKMLGYEPGKLASIPLERVVSPDSLGQTLAMLERVGRSPGTPSHHEIKLLTKAGEIRSADAIASAVSTEGAVTWVQAIVRDTTEENALRNKLIEEKRRSERLIEDSESIIIGVDSGLRVNIFNSGATKLLGYSRSEVMGRDMLDLNILQGLPVERMRGAPPDSAKMIPRNVDGWVQTKNGDRLRIAWNVGQTFDGDGSVTGTIAFGTDITSKAALADLLE
ncbi:MAG TPA: PAS domain-containing protein, partial [Methanomassiliicoccales archaeon]|nr:PAS domain-containing protein [Methanomassiliicoccales archaeon]